jgi:hypothetical protein
MNILDPSDVGKLCYKSGGSQLAYSSGQPNLIFRSWFTVPIASIYQKYGVVSGSGTSFPDPETIAPDAVDDMKAYTWGTLGVNMGAQEYTYNHTVPPDEIPGPKVWSVIARAALYRVDTSALPSGLRSNITNMVFSIQNDASRSFRIRGNPQSSSTPSSNWSTCTSWGSGYSGSGSGDIYLGGGSSYFSLSGDYLFIFIYFNTYDYVGSASEGLWSDQAILTGLSAKVV